MKHRILIFFILCTLIFSFENSFSQQPVSYSEPQMTYKKAFELFNQQAYGPARKMFDKLIEEYGNNKKNTFVEDSYFYRLVCAAEIKDGDALVLAENFIKTYTVSAHLPSTYFYMGKLYFDKRKYRQTIEVFDKINPGKLTKDERYEYFYKKGLSYLKINKPEESLELLAKVMNTDNVYSDPAKYYYAHIQYLKKNYDEALKLFEELKNNRRFKKYVSEYLAHIYYEKNQFDKVIPLGEELFKHARTKSKGIIAGLLGNSYYELGNYDKALEYYRYYEKYTGKITPEDNYRIGVVKYKAGLFDEAIPNFEQATSLNNDLSQSAWDYLGFSYFKSSQDKFARDAFLKAYKLNKDKEISDDALFNYAKATIKTGGDPYNDEIKILEEYINNNGNSSKINEAYDYLVQLLLISKNYDQTLNYIEKTSGLTPQLKEIYQTLAYNKGIELVKRSKFKEASEAFGKALKFPEKPDIFTESLYWKAESLYRLGKYSQAEIWYKKFLQHKTAVNTKYYPVAFYNLGYVSFKQKKYNQAISYFTRFLKQKNISDNMATDATLRIADSYLILKEYDKAISYYDKVINKGGQDSDYALYQKASCYGAQGNFNQKINNLNILVSRYKRSPLYTDALYEIGSTYLTINDQRHAISSFNKIVREKPKSVYAKKALMKTGLLYYGNNQTANATKIFKQVIKKYPASTEAVEALNALKNIYTESGKVDDYIKYAKQLDFVQVSTSEEDTLTFAAGENFYIEGKCDAAINALSKYLNKFPKGGFVIKSYYYMADCFAKMNDLNSALTYYKKVIKYPDNDYTLKSLLTAARIDYDTKNYKEAYEFYSKLLEIAESKEIILEALDGMMRSAFYLKKYNKAANAAKQLMKTDKVSQNQIVFAHYVLAKTAFEKNNLKEARKEFAITDKLTTNEWGAESKFHLAEIDYGERKYDKAEKTIFQLSDNYPDYPYWVAKGFILLADIYLERGNAFQAKQTLKSIIDNYNGDDLKTIAREKLKKIEEKEKKEGKEAENEQ